LKILEMTLKPLFGLWNGITVSAGALARNEREAQNGQGIKRL
jgi:hypothetical protein